MVNVCLYTAHFTEAFDRTKPQCGLLLDEWTEVLPGQRFAPGMDDQTVHTQTTGVAVHFDRPNAEAPQSWLLVTPARWDGNWRWRDLRQALPETMDLARTASRAGQRSMRRRTRSLLPPTGDGWMLRMRHHLQLFGAHIGPRNR